MTRFHISGLLVAVVAFTDVPRSSAAEIEPEDVKPGLIATYRDSAKPAPAEVIRLELTIALNLSASEAPHPRLAPDGGVYRWQGFVNVTRAGAYRFEAQIRGKFSLKIGGKEVFTAKSEAAEPARVQSALVQMESGVQPLEAEFTRLPGTARLELSWVAPQQRPEPLPYQQLGHLPKQESPAFRANVLQERGRFLAEEHGCVRCHQPAANDRVGKRLHLRQGPDLSKIGQRVYAGWIDRWLADPQGFRPGAAMSKLFADDAAGRAERHAVARYLSALGGPLGREGTRPNLREQIASAGRGRALFTTVGCAACHLDSHGSQAVVRLGNLGDKTRPDRLTDYLRDPLAVHPDGRMPSLNLDAREALDLARFLCKDRDEELSIRLEVRKYAPPKEVVAAVWKALDAGDAERAAFGKLPAERQWLDLGRRLLITKGCVNCHTIAPDGKPLPTLAVPKSLGDIRKAPADRGCLAPDSDAKTPHFGFGRTERDALAAFLKGGLDGAGSAAHSYAARIALKRFNCLNCHQREGEGGLSAELVEQMAKFAKAENAEEIRPPVLTGIGHKLRTPWLKAVLAERGRARPWMALRMPQFGEANVGFLSEALAALEGAEPDATVHSVAITPAKIAAGRQMVGKSGLGCISCHDIAGIPNAGTRGPDLASINQRVRYDWYRRWLEQPQRMAPGTRMPQVFLDGKSLLPSVLDGNADAQAEAMWAYLSLGPNLPLPAGLEPPKGLAVAVGERPVLLRTFMPDAGSRAIAVGYPGGTSVAFDARACRLAYAWAGNFLDASPVWNNRGGNPAKLLGPKFWSAPPGNPWALGGPKPPDFLARSKDPAYGAELPPNQLFDGEPRVHFDGYTLDKGSAPTFRYRVGGESGPELTLTERIEPLKSSIASGIVRRFTLEGPGGRPAWFLAGETGGVPKLLDRRGEVIQFELKPEGEVPAAGRWLVLPQEGERALLLSVATAPEGTRWRFQPRPGGGWLAVVRFPMPKEAAKAEFALSIWSVGRAEPELLKALIGGPR